MGIFNDSGLSNGTTYYYTVTGVNNVGEGPGTAQVALTPTAPGQVRTPSFYPYGVLPTGWTPAQLCTLFKTMYAAGKTFCLTQTGMPAGMGGGAWRCQVPDVGSAGGSQYVNCTFSEGMGYWMLFTAYCSDSTSPIYDPNAAAIFQGLSTYYQYYLDSNGLMNWRIQADGTISGTGGASDGDFDARKAYQVYSELHETGKTGTYGTLCTNLTNAIAAHEFYPANRSTFANEMVNGDGWVDIDASGYDNRVIMLDYADEAGWRMAGRWSGNVAGWEARITAMQRYRDMFRTNWVTAMVPDGCYRDGTQTASPPGYSYKNGYNSERYPLRAGQFFLNTNDATVGAQLKKTATFLLSQSPSNVAANLRSVYSLDGTVNDGYNNAAFMAGYMVACCSQASTAALAGDAVTYLANSSEASYFAHGLKVYGLLIATGEARMSFAGAIPSTQNATAAVRTQTRAQGTAKKVLPATGQMRAQARLQGTGTMVSQTTSGGLKTRVRLQGTAQSFRNAAGTMQTRVRLQGTTTMVVVTSAQLKARVKFQGGTGALIQNTAGTVRTAMRLAGTNSTVVRLGAASLRTQGRFQGTGQNITQNANGSFTTRSALQATGIFPAPLFKRFSIRFKPAGSSDVAGWQNDIGQAYDPTRGFGWEVATSTAAIQALLQTRLTFQGTGTVIKAGSGALTSRTRLQGTPVTAQNVQAAIRAQIQLRATARVYQAAAGAITSRSQVAGTSTQVLLKNGTLATQARLQGTGTLIKQTAATMTNRAQLLSTGILVKLIAATLTTQARLQATGASVTVYQAAAGGLTSRTRLQTTATVIKLVVATMTSRTQLQATATVIKPAAGAIISQTRLQATAVAIVSTPLDLSSQNAYGAYSLRKLRAAYGGSAIKIRRSSDSTTADIGFDAAGALDTTAIATFVGANSAFIDTWYDQSGNARNMTATATTKQMRIVNAGTVDTKGTKSKPSATFTTTTQGYKTASQTAYTGTTLSVMMVGAMTADTTTSESPRFLSVFGAPPDDSVTASAMAIARFSAGSPTQQWGSNRGGTWIQQVTGVYGQLQSVAQIYDGTNGQMFVDATSGTATASTASFSVTVLSLAYDGNLEASNLGGYVSEFYFFELALTSTNRTVLRGNQQSYYGLS